MANNKPKTWETYEQVAASLLNTIAHEFGLGKVEGKQIVPGESGADWEIEAKGIRLDGDGFLIIECRRYTKSRLPQEKVAAVAYRIQDTRAKGGIIVSPLDLQSGAKKVANQAGIIHVRLSPESTTTDYVLSFLNKIFVGLSDSIGFKGDLVETKKVTAVCNKGNHPECADHSCDCDCHPWTA
jgi:hypothetical protein